MRYGFVGLLGVGIDMVCFCVGCYCFEANPSFAKLMSGFIAMTCNFVLNDIWTFKFWNEGAAFSRLRRFAGFVGVSLVGLSVCVGIVVVSTRWGLRPIWLANAIAISFGSGFNYVLSRFWLWQKRS